MPVMTDDVWTCWNCMGDLYYVGGPQEGRWCVLCGKSSREREVMQDERTKEPDAGAVAARGAGRRG